MNPPPPRSLSSFSAGRRTIGLTSLSLSLSRFLASRESYYYNSGATVGWRCPMCCQSNNGYNLTACTSPHSLFALASVRVFRQICVTYRGAAYAGSTIAFERARYKSHHCVTIQYTNSKPIEYAHIRHALRSHCRVPATI